ncbi:MAG: hypothetical protein D6690_17655 [Nitrospirae bacterium]|nr:MAG: hypothetical protein D6690_17655 [Nitrospirota bacterium]
MISTALWLVSVVLQAIAAAFAVRSLRHAHRRIGWMLIAGALTLMTIHRAMPLMTLIEDHSWQTPNLVDGLVALVIAALIVGGVALIAPLLVTCKRSDQLYEALREHQALTQQLHEGLLRTFQQLKIAVEVGKPTTLLLALINEAIANLQRVTEEMKSGLLVGENFELSLRSLIDSMVRDHPSRVKIHLDPGIGKYVSKEEGTQLLHIVREAISNSQKHGRASREWVSMTKKNGAVVLEIKDNGRGFEVDLVEAQGHGLGNMVARAKKIGAKLKIQSQPQMGTRVVVEVPIKACAQP